MRLRCIPVGGLKGYFEGLDWWQWRKGGRTSVLWFLLLPMTFLKHVLSRILYCIYGLVDWKNQLLSCSGCSGYTHVTGAQSSPPPSAELEKEAIAITIHRRWVYVD